LARIGCQCVKHLIIFSFLSLFLRVLTAPATQVGLNAVNAFLQFVVQ
jgi:hypothetical protein